MHPKGQMLLGCISFYVNVFFHTAIINLSHHLLFFEKRLAYPHFLHIDSVARRRVKPS